MKVYRTGVLVANNRKLYKFKTKRTKMKQFEDLTTDELVALTDKEINTYVDYQCAVEGIKLLPAHPGKEPEKPQPKQLETMSYVLGIYTKDTQLASNLMKLINKSEIYKKEGYSSDGNIRFERLTPDGDSYYYPKIQTESAMSKDEYIRLKGEIDEWRKKVTIWRDANSEYKKIKEQRQDIQEEITNTIDQARSDVTKAENLLLKYNRYLDLAGGDEVIAKKFLEDAEHPTQDEMDKLLEMLTADPSSTEA